jgi:hypothetical protein
MIAAITTGFMQFMLILLVGFAAVVVLSFGMIGLGMFGAVSGGGWGGAEWISEYYTLAVVAAAAIAVVLWQYRTRRSWPARAAAGAAALAVMLGTPFSWSTAFALQSRISARRMDESKLRAGIRTDMKWMTRAFLENGGQRVRLQIPLEIRGTPDDVTVTAEGITAEIDGPGGAVWRANGNPRGTASQTGQLIDLHTTVDGAFYKRVQNEPVRIRGFVYLTLFGNRRVSQVPFDRKTVVVPGMGRCLGAASGAAEGRLYSVLCTTSFRPRNSRWFVRFESKSKEPLAYQSGPSISYSPFPAQLGLNPVSQYLDFSTFKGPLEAATVETIEPLSHVKAALEIEGLRLGDYEVRIGK